MEANRHGEGRKEAEKIRLLTGSMDTFGAQSNGQKSSRSSGNFPVSSVPDAPVVGKTRLEEVCLDFPLFPLCFTRLALKRSRVI